MNDCAMNVRYCTYIVSSPAIRIMMKRNYAVIDTVFAFHMT